MGSGARTGTAAAVNLLRVVAAAAQATAAKDGYSDGEQSGREQAQRLGIHLTTSL
jgi:hypothetical protein